MSGPAPRLKSKISVVLTVLRPYRPMLFILLAAEVGAVLLGDFYLVYPRAVLAVIGVRQGVPLHFVWPAWRALLTSFGVGTASVLFVFRNAVFLVWRGVRRQVRRVAQTRRNA